MNSKFSSSETTCGVDGNEESMLCKSSIIMLKLLYLWKCWNCCCLFTNNKLTFSLFPTSFCVRKLYAKVYISRKTFLSYGAKWDSLREAFGKVEISLENYFIL